MVVVPEGAPPPGLVPIATVTLPLNPVTVLPSPSCTVTVTGGVIVAPAVTLVGCPVKTRRFAAAGSMLNAELLAPVRPVGLGGGVWRGGGLSVVGVAELTKTATAAAVGVPSNEPP